MSDNYSEKPYQYQIKAAMLGSGGVGKTSFLDRYFNNKFTRNYLQTIGFNSISKIMKLPNGESVKVTFSDTSGQERYKSITSNCLRNVQGILLMYDIANKNSFDCINYWLDLIKDTKDVRTFPVILIGNKIDLKDERVISKENGKNKAEELNLHFYEISVKDKINVNEPVLDLIYQISSKINNNQNCDNSYKGFKIEDHKKNGKKKHKKGCCHGGDKEGKK